MTASIGSLSDDEMLVDRGNSSETLLPPLAEEGAVRVSPVIISRNNAVATNSIAVSTMEQMKGAALAELEPEFVTCLPDEDDLLEASESSYCFDDEDEDEYDDNADQQYHEWYLPEEFCSHYEVPILFEDGMDLVECELYYAAHEQGNGGFVFASKKKTSGSRNASSPTSVAAMNHQHRTTSGHRPHWLLRKELDDLPLPSCLRPSKQSSRDAHADYHNSLDVPASLPQRVEVDRFHTMNHHQPLFPAMRRCSYAGVVSTKNMMHHHPVPSKNKTSSQEEDSESTASTASCEEEVQIAKLRDHDERRQDSVASTLLSPSARPPTLPRRRSSLLALHRKARSQSEIEDLCNLHVSFAPTVQVTTIPAAWEYPEELAQTLWHTRKELKEFLRQAAYEKKQRARRRRKQGYDDDEDEEDEQEGSGRGRNKRNNRRRNKKRQEESSSSSSKRPVGQQQKQEDEEEEAFYEAEFDDDDEEDELLP